MSDRQPTGTTRRNFLRAAGVGGATAAGGFAAAQNAEATNFFVTMSSSGTYSRYFYHSDTFYNTYVSYYWYENWSFYSSYSTLNWIKLVNTCPYTIYARGMFSADGSPLSLNTGAFSVTGKSGSGTPGYRTWYLSRRFYVRSGRITQQVLQSSTQAGLNFTDSIEWRRG